MKKNQSLINNMTEGPLMKQLVQFSIPIILGNLLQSGYTIADMVIVGRFIGADGLSAVGIGGLLQNLLLMAGFGLGFGGQIILSQQVGAGARKNMQKTIGTFMTIVFISAVGFGAVGIGLTKPLLLVLNTPASVYEQTQVYYLICCAGIIFTYGYNCVSSVLRGLGESKLPTVFIAVAAVLNIGLDFLLIGVLEMNVGGAALATVISQGISFITCLVYLYQKRDSLGFDFQRSSFKPDKKTASIIIKLSLPIIIFGFLMSISSMFINSNINAYGIAASAADGIGNKINMLANAITMGLYTGGGAIIGQCFGAKNNDRIRKTYRLTIGLSLIIWAGTALLLIVFSNSVFRMFTPDPEVLAMSRSYLVIASVNYLGMALATGAYSLFEGTGNTNMEMITGIIENIVIKIALSILFSHLFGFYGYWMGWAVASYTTFIVGSVYYHCGHWQQRTADLPD